MFAPNQLKFMYNDDTSRSITIIQERINDGPYKMVDQFEETKDHLNEQNAAALKHEEV